MGSLPRRISSFLLCLSFLFIKLIETQSSDRFINDSVVLKTFSDSISSSHQRTLEQSAKNSSMIPSITVTPNRILDPLCELKDRTDLIDVNFPKFDSTCTVINISNVSMRFTLPLSISLSISSPQSILIISNLQISMVKATLNIENKTNNRQTLGKSNGKRTTTTSTNEVNQEGISLEITYGAQLLITNSSIEINSICSFSSTIKTSQLAIENSQLTAYSILLIAGSITASESTYIAATESFCKTASCSCNSDFDGGFPEYENPNPSYLSFLQDANLTSGSFDIPATLIRYNQPTLLDLLEYNVFEDSNPMRVQLIAFAYTSISLLNNTMLSASNIALYSTIVSALNVSAITTNNQGCLSNLGIGCGIYNPSFGLYQCGGSGASHGGQGGSPISLDYVIDVTCNEVMSRKLYGDAMNPIFEGSGGGNSLSTPNKSNSGGGVVYIEAIIQVLLIKSSISSNSISAFSETLNNGGGSGGSIQIHSLQLRGNDSIVMANGGNGYGSGGAGAGGRIKLNFTNWQNTTLWLDQKYDNLQILVEPGLPFLQEMIAVLDSNSSVDFDPNIARGTIRTSPCPPQFEALQGYRCTICQAGTYKMFDGWQTCQSCIDLPENSTPSLDEPNLSSQMCSYTCNKDYHSVNSQCLDTSSYIVYKLGGWDVIIPTITLVLCLMSIVLGRLLDNRRRKRSPSELHFHQALYTNNASQHIYDVQLFQEESQKRIDFLVEDLPYHMKRIYLHGENTHKKPWKINAEDDEFEMEALAIEFNAMSKYTKFQTRVLSVFKVFYIVSYFWASRYMKNLKLIDLKNIIRTHTATKRVYDEDREENPDLFRFKLSTSQDLSLAFIDVFNYNNTVLDWQNQTNFPVCLILAGKGSFISPFHIYIEDPLCKSLFFTFQSKESLDYNEIDHSMIRFEKFLKKFNVLSKLIDYSSREATFLNNFCEIVKYVDQQNKRFFAKFQVEADICIHKLVRDKFIPEEGQNAIFGFEDHQLQNHNNHLQSRIIMLSYKDKGELINCLKDTHYLKNYSKFYEIKISLNFYRINNVIHNDQVEIKTENNINKQIQTYVNYEQDEEEFQHLMNKMQKKNYSDLENVRRSNDFIMRPHRIENVYNQLNTESIIDENRCFWIALIFFYLRRVFGIFKSSFLTYRKSHLSPNVLGILLLIIMIIHILSVISTFASFFFNVSYKSTEILIVMMIYPLCFAVSPLIMIAWLVKHTEGIGKLFMLFNYNAFYTYIVISIFGLIDIVQISGTIQTLVCVMKIAGVITTWLMSYFGSGYILLQEMI